MPQIVRVAIGEKFPNLTWPACCPECGTTKSLMKSSSRVGRIKAEQAHLRGGLKVDNGVLHLSYLICPAHAAETQWANRLLENSAVMILIRSIFYLGAGFALALLVGPYRLSNFAELGALLALPILGIAGITSLIWARIATSLRPMRYDPKKNVIVIRFRQAPYATKFRVMNPEATSNQDS
ncbi:hypothetical protein [Undibacterium sp.]|uniref:hypothetical protein n=1 Tax=Undibacterium sp. TaxID=1914977 RepID=UPI0037516574